MRIIKSMEEKYLLPALDLIEAVFTDYENAEDARSVAVKTLPAGTRVELLGEIRNAAGKFWYETQLDGESGFVFGGNLEAIPEEGWFARFWKTLFP